MKRNSFPPLLQDSQPKKYEEFYERSGEKIWTSPFKKNINDNLFINGITRIGKSI
jgi:hypothetical protein